MVSELEGRYVDEILEEPVDGIQTNLLE